IVHRCLRKKSDERFQSLEEVVIELEPIARVLQRDMVEDLVRQGQELVQKKEFGKARELLRNALMVDSSHGMAKTLMGQVTTELKRQETYPKIQELMVNGETALRDGKYQEASQKFEEVLRMDSQHGQAQELLERARRELTRAQKVRQGIEISQRAISEGDLTLAESELQKVFEVDAENVKAKAMLGQVHSERAGRERRARLLENLRQARNLLIQQNYESCIQLLEGLKKEFAGEAELEQLLQTARDGFEEQKREKLVNAKMDEARDFVSQQQYEKAIAVLEELLKAYPKEHAAARLLETAREEHDLFRRRQAVAAQTDEARRLINKRQYEKAIGTLEALLKEYPDETAAKKLLQTARESFEDERREQTVSSKMKEARALLGQQQYDKSLAALGELLEAYPNETGAVTLRQLVEQEKQEREQQQRLEQEQAGLRELMEKKDFARAITLGERLLKQFPEDPEIGRLLAAARTEKQTGERRKQVETLQKSIQELLEAGKVDQAQREAETALKKFPDVPELTTLLQAAQKARDERTKKADLERRIRAIKIAIEREELTSAIDLSKQALANHPNDTDVNQLLSFAQREYETREKKRGKEEQLKEAVAHLEQKDFDGATVMLKNIAQEFPFDPQVKELLNAAKAHEPPPSSATIIGGPMITQGPEADAGSVYVMDKPAAAPQASAAAPSPGTTIGPPMVPPPPKAPESAPPAPPKPEAAPPPPPPPPKPEPKPPKKPKVEAKPAPAAPPKPEPAPPPKPEAKPTPVVEPPPKPAPPPRPAEPSFAPPAEIEAPLWKKPAGMAIGGVLLLVLIVGAVLVMRRGTPETTTDTGNQTQTQDTTDTGPRPDSAADQQQALIDAAQKLADAGDYNGARAKLDEAERVSGGPHGSRIVQLRQQMQKEEQDSGLRAVVQQESQIWTEAEGHLNAKRFDQAERSFRRILALPQGGRRRADADRMVREVIPQRKDEERFFSQAQSAAQQRNDEGKLQEADQLLTRVIALNGPRRQEAQQLQNQVKGRLNELAGEKSASERQQQIAAAENEARQELRRGNFLAARQKAEQIRRLQGDPGGVLGEIDAAERSRLQQLENQFNSARSQKDKRALRGLVNDFQKLVESGGPTGRQAQEYAENRIPQAVQDIEAEEERSRQAATRRAEVSPVPVNCAAYDRPVSAGAPMSERFLDGCPVRFSSTPLPSDLAQRAAAGSSVMIRFEIDESGRVTGGRVLQGDAAIGQEIISAAQQGWQHPAPKIRGTGVKTGSTVTVRF
ncbi:MAG: tetratricopeptide repeat protein, partial [Candidatus Acidiferrales bacterium]